jgi:hypothetical protein
MARTKQNISKEQKASETKKELQHKYDTIKVSFEAGKLEGFDQIDAIVRPSVLAKQLHMGYKAFKNKCNSPGDFSNNELSRMAELFDVDINLLIKFIFKLMRYKNKFKSGEPIRL